MNACVHKYPQKHNFTIISYFVCHGTMNELYFKVRLAVFTAMKNQAVVIWVMTSCSDVIGYQRFRGSTYHITTRHHNLKTTTWIF